MSAASRSYKTRKTRKLYNLRTGLREYDSQSKKVIPLNDAFQKHIDDKFDSLSEDMQALKAEVER